MHALLTGHPGFIARRLVRALVADGDGDVRITALVEKRMAAIARAEAPPEVEVVVGDIARPRLGLSGSEYERIAQQTTDVFHLAAIYSLAVPLETAQRVNVDGTGNVIEFCRAAPNLRRHHYVSTAYVAGERHGVVYEHELALGQGFKNHYESTKFQAEVWVRESMGDVPTTILRPGIVVGDSRTGETQKFDGPYYLLRLVSLCARRRLPQLQIGSERSAFNVVPVDFVVAAIAASARSEEAAGQTLHLVDPEPVSAAELTRLLGRAYGAPKPRLKLPPRLVGQALRVALLRRIFANTPRESIRYLNHAVRFDTRVADRVLGAQGVHCPRLPEYVDTMTAFFKANEHDPALEPPSAA